MTRSTRFHVNELPEGHLMPKHLTKQQFGRRLYHLMLARGWNQSELARQAGLPRDSISTYVRGVALPTPKSLQALAEALHGGSWEKDYTLSQRAVWKMRVRAAVEDEPRSRHDFGHAVDIVRHAPADGA